MGFSPDFLFSMGLLGLFLGLIVAMQVFQGPPAKRPDNHAAE